VRISVQRLIFLALDDALIKIRASLSTVIYPDPRGVITPSFHATHPNHLKFKGGYQGGVYGGVYVIVMEGVKY